MGLLGDPKSVQDTDASQFTPQKGLGNVTSRKLKDRRVVTRVMCHQGLGPAVGLLEGDGTMPKIMSGATLKRFFPRRMPGGVTGGEHLCRGRGRVPRGSPRNHHGRRRGLASVLRPHRWTPPKGPGGSQHPVSLSAPCPSPPSNLASAQGL